MSLALPVSSFPNSAYPSPQSSPFGGDLTIAVSTTKKRNAFIKNLFTKNQSSSDQHPSIVVAHSKEPVTGDAISQDQPRYPSRSRSLRFPVPSRSHDTPAFNSTLDSSDHDRRLIADSPSGSLGPLWTDGLTYYRTPRTTKESIANLGLTCRNPSPDFLAVEEHNRTVAYCCTRGFVDLHPLPPLPPLPPATPPSPLPELPCHKMQGSRRASVVGDEFHDNEAQIMISDDDAKPPSERSLPPSPITFSHRRASYIAVGLPGDDHDRHDEPVSIEIKSPSAPDLRKRSSALKSPTRCRPDPPPLDIGLATMGLPWMRSFAPVTHVAPPPRRKKSVPAPKPTITTSPSQPVTPISTSPVSSRGWASKLFRRRRSSISVLPLSKPEDGSRNITIVTQTLTQGSMSSTLQSEGPLTPRVAQMTDRDSDADTLRLEGEGERQVQPLLTAHHAVGDVWEEKGIEEVISTLRTMKVSGKLRL